MRRGLALALVAAALGAVLLAAAATSDAPTLASRGPTLDWNLQIDRQPAPRTVTTTPESTPVERDGGDVPEGLTIVLIAIVVVAATMLGAAVLRALVRAWRDRPRLVWRRRRGRDDFDVLEPAQVAAAVAADAAAQREALQRGSPRNAIVECWLRLESVIVDAGLPRRPSDTSTDLVERTLATYAVDPDAIGELAALYREARFSSHPMGEVQRRRAIASLDAVHADLQASTTGRETATMSAGTPS